MLDVKVFQINECDAVAAKSENQAKAFYLQQTGLPEKEAFQDDITEVSPEAMIWEDETMMNKIPLKKIIEKYWTGTPFIAATTEW